jgi:hypothetical protein
MKVDQWHFKRTELAEKVISMFEIGLSSALTFFAPRRMGKTEFLIKDIIPLAQTHHWQAHYYSFLDADAQAQQKYAHALIQFGIDNKIIKTSDNQIKKLGASAMGLSAQIEMDHAIKPLPELISLVQTIGQHQKTILLLDEVQALAYQPRNKSFLAALRTALDTNKDQVKVIFTGSSREGLKQMFSSAQAPFFHFGQNLDLPALDKRFTDHLCCIYQRATKNQLDTDQLWQVFQALDYVPQLIRSLVERVALNPGLTVEQAKQALLQDLYDDRHYSEVWDHCSALERVVLKAMAKKNRSLYSRQMLNQFAKQLSLDELKSYTVQSAVKTLVRKHLIVRCSSNNRFIIEDPNFQHWVTECSK